jgi:hypothetical protein
MKKTIAPNLPHIKAHHITSLAASAKCDWSYVWMIVNGKREANSPKAKAILAAATKLNDGIDKITKGVQKEFILIGEND